MEAVKTVMKALGKAMRQLGDPMVVRVLVKSVGVTLLVFVALGASLFAGLTWAFAAAGLSDGGLASAAAAVLIAVLAAWLLLRVVAVAVLQFFADEVVAAVEQAHYPEAAKRAKPLPFRRDLANSLRGIGRTVAANLLALPVALVLLITGIGAAAVFLGVNAWLLGRELTDMAWLRHCDAGDNEAAENPVPRLERVLLGGAIAAIMLVPVLGLVAPVIGAAAGTHLAQKAMGLSGSRGEQEDA